MLTLALPRLAAHLPARLLLTDPAADAAGMAAQVDAAADLFGVKQITLVGAFSGLSVVTRAPITPLSPLNANVEWS